MTARRSTRASASTRTKTLVGPHERAGHWDPRAVDLFTIGFTQTSAERFFERLRAAGVKRVVDVRLHNTSQLAGFAKAGDLRYFLRAIGGIDYVHEPLLAPTEAMFAAYKKAHGPFSELESGFRALMDERHIEDRIRPDLLDGGCLLCSEATPDHCHRRLVAEHLNERWGGLLRVTHL